MDFFELINSRHSIRVFTTRKIEPEKECVILEAANYAPSAGNLQAYEIYAVRQRKALKALSEAAYDQESIAEARLVLVFCAHPARNSKQFGTRGRSLYCIQDATIACAYAQLAVTGLGLASVWVGHFEEDRVREVLDIGPDLLPVSLLPIGYAGMRTQLTTRRPIQDLVHSIE